ncbi:MAG: orotate phosphoribosyltransferase [Bacteroidetes bacterium]|nr:orotate phosphoribosyltransferase [Bacteroidota bacterium]
MTKIESKKVEINKSSKEVFDFLANFTNFSLLVPDKVENWKATIDNCSFTIKGLTDFGMKISQRNEFTSIVIVNDEAVSMPVKFVFNWFFKSISENKVEVEIVFNLDINPMMAMMVKKPLGDFVNVLVDKLKEKMESN